MPNDDNVEYFRFTGPQRLDKAMHTLEGLIEGVAIDRKVNDRELALITSWIGAHQQYADVHPFNEVLPRLYEIMADGKIDDEEKADILWLCRKFNTANTYFDDVTSDMQRLHGLLGGIAADRKISVEELYGLQGWLDEHTQLRTCWPYDELESLLLAVLKDGKIDEEEHQQLLAFFQEFLNRPGHAVVKLIETDEPKLTSGICAVCPEIDFDGRVFCFTGKSERFTRAEFAEAVKRHGGIYANSVTKDVNYLTIGGHGNPCWSYSCYGRKVEQAITNRKNGSRIILLHEYDLWDALEDM